MTKMGSVLLYSGGLDSYALAHILQPDTLLHVNMGTAYGQLETRRLAIPAGWRGQLAFVDLPLVQWERPDAIIPGRNAHLVLCAANHGDEIWLAATAGDRVTDKDEVFAERMNDLLAHLFQPQWWLPEGRNVRLSLPAKEWTKQQLVAEYLAAGGDPVAIAYDTVSCYTPRDGDHCGACKPCARKWVALKVNSVEPGYDAEAFVRATYLPAIENGSWDRGQAEAAAVLGALGVIP